MEIIRTRLLRKNILFLINPVSGGKSKLDFPALAVKYLDETKFHPEFLFTERQGHAFEIAAAADDMDIVVAVGGDGTVNEIASALDGSVKCMGIIPCGSGNGLARALGIPLNEKKAILRLNKLHITRIDSGNFNGRKFFNMAGIGFDAHISALFAREAKRGLKGYVKKTLSEIAEYRSARYHIEIDGKSLNREAFMISIANSAQYGNNAYISPSASLRDGLLDVCIIKPFPLYKLPVLGLRMFNKSAHRSAYVEIVRAREVCIFRESEGAVHLDGEPVEMGRKLSIRVQPLSLSLIA